MQRLLVFDEHAKGNFELEKELGEFSAKLKSVNENIIHSSKLGVKNPDGIDASSSVIPTAKGIIIGSLSSFEAEKHCMRLLSALGIVPILQVPDGVSLKSENIFSLQDELYIGISDQCSLKSLLFLKKRLVDAKGLFSKVNAIKVKGFELADVFRVVNVGKKKIYFVNWNAVNDEFDVFDGESHRKALLSRLARKESVYSLSHDESWLLGNRFFVFRNTAFIFDNMKSISGFLVHHGFSVNNVNGKAFAKENKGLNDIVKALG
jgi:hypothetical protein